MTPDSPGRRTIQLLRLFHLTGCDNVRKLGVHTSETHNAVSLGLLNRRTEDIFDLSPDGLACLEQHNARQFCNTEWDDAEWFALLNRKPYYKTEEKT
tara:strand:- start:2230 stop:2520 length:291 start_codon:yes stop_codon:yes gene_type:complete